MVDDDTWVYADGVWSNLTGSLAAAPPPLAGGGMVYDPTDGYYLMFGGLEGYGGPPQNQTWTYSNGAWSNLTGSLPMAPLARFGQVMVYDPLLGCTVLFGGWGNGSAFGGTFAFNDTWEFCSGAWTNVTGTAGGPMAGLGWAASTYDPRMGAVVFNDGAGYAASPFYNGTWEFTVVGGVGTWHNISSMAGPAPPIRRAGSMAYDPSYGYDLLIEGDVPNSSGGWNNIGAVWALDNGTWMNLSSTISSLPPTRFDASLFWDPTAGALVLFGGCTDIGCPYGLEDTWRYSWNVSVTLSASTSLLYLGSSVTLTARATSGGPTYSYAYSGLPSGCVSNNVSKLQCNPNASGNFTPSVSVTGYGGTGAGSSARAAASLLRVVSDLQLSASLNRPQLDIGSSFWINSTARGGVGGYSYSYQGLPGGCKGTNVSALLCSPSASGAFSVGVTVRDARTGQASQTVSGKVFSSLVVGGAPSSVLLDVDQNVSFNVSVSGGSGGPFGYVWSIAGGTCPVISGPSVTCTATSAGTIEANVSVNDSDGGRASYSFGAVRYVERPSLTISAVPGSGVSPLTVAFQGTVSAGVAPYAFQWVFGDGLTDVSNSVTHVYGIPGIYVATLWVNDSRAAGAIASETVRVGGPLGLALTVGPATDEIDHPAELNTSITGGTVPITFSWTGLPPGCAGGNVSSVLCDPTGAGTYTVAVAAHDAFGSSVEESVMFVVAPRLTVTGSFSYGASTTCSLEQNVTFTGSAAGGVGPYVYLWKFGDGQGSTLEAPEHTYTTAPANPSSLTVTDSLGVNATSTSNVSIVLPTPGCPVVISPVVPSSVPPWWEGLVLPLGVVLAAAIVVGIVILARWRRAGSPAQGLQDQEGPQAADEAPPSPPA